MLIGQAAAATAAAVLVGLFAGGDPLSLAAMPDFGLLVVLLAWAACIAAGVFKLGPLIANRPLMSVWVGIVPAGLGLLMAGLSQGQGIAGDDCGLMRLTWFLVERSRLTGFLACGSLWLGSLPLLLAGHSGEERPKIYAGCLSLMALVAWAAALQALPRLAEFLHAADDPGLPGSFDWAMAGLGSCWAIAAWLVVISAAMVGVFFVTRSKRPIWKKLLPVLVALVAMAVLDAGTSLLTRDQYLAACRPVPAVSETPAPARPAG